MVNYAENEQNTIHYNQRRKGEKIRISGYFLARKSSSEDDEDGGSDDEDFEDIDFGNETVFDRETAILRAKCLKWSKEKFQEFDNGKVHEVSGCFPMVDPWWNVTMYIQDGRLVGKPSYRLRIDGSVGEEEGNFVMLFLMTCKVHVQDRLAFHDYVKLCNKLAELTFDNLFELLDAFAVDNKPASAEIRSRISSAPEGIYLLNSIKFPLLNEVLPQLLPRHFRQILRLEEGILSEIEDALEQEPWVFGFSWLVTKTFKIHGCEASFKNFYNCSEIYNQLSDTHKDSLYIYELLKDNCRRYGHTFVPFVDLKRHKIQNRKLDGDLPPKYEVKDWKEGLDFLEDKRIIKREPTAKDQNIYLYRYWFAEKEIAEHLETLMFPGDSSQLKINIDFESGDFDQIRTDEDQLKAARVIVSNPVVVLSGKGGCGKTEVVARVFGYAKRIWTQELELPTYNEAGSAEGTEFLPRPLSNPDIHVLELDGVNQLQTEPEFDQLDDQDIIRCSQEIDLMCYAHYCHDLSRSIPSLSEISDDECVRSVSSQNCLVFGSPDLDRTAATVDFHELETEKLTQCVTDQSRHEFGDQELSQSANTQAYPNREISSSNDEKNGRMVEGCILLTAPTGKAANLLGQRSDGMKGYTLHQVVYSYFAWKRNTVDQQPWKFADVRVLIVDESSLVAVTIFQQILRVLLMAAKLSKVILLGDVNQLPSVEPGQLFADVYKSLETAGCSVTLRTNHRAESEFIVQNSNRILQQRMPLFDPAKHFCMQPLIESEDNDRDVAVRALLQSEGFPCHEKSQFVAFRKRDCEAINELCCKHYNNHSIKKRDSNGKTKTDFQIGDKVCCTRNAYVADFSDNKTHLTDKNDNEIRLCNGEIFFIVAMVEIQEDGKRLTYVTLLNADREIKVSLDALINQCKLKHAWARTIHTFQGSETDALIYVVGSKSGFQNWQHVYTAVTRGRKLVHIVTEKSSLEFALRQIPKPRNTSLKARLKSMLTSQPQVHADAPEQYATPSTKESARRGGGDTPVSGSKRKPDPVEVAAESPSTKQKRADRLVTSMKRLSFQNDS